MHLSIVTPQWVWSKFEAKLKTLRGLPPPSKLSDLFIWPWLHHIFLILILQNESKSTWITPFPNFLWGIENLFLPIFCPITSFHDSLIALHLFIKLCRISQNLPIIPFFRIFREVIGGLKPKNTFTGHFLFSPYFSTNSLIYHFSAIFSRNSSHRKLKSNCNIIFQNILEGFRPFIS